MKNLFLTALLLLSVSFAFANTEVTTDIDVDNVKNVINTDNLTTSKDKVLSCTSKTVTVTTTNADGSSTSTSTTTVTCDTAGELAQYHAAMQQLGIKR